MGCLLLLWVVVVGCCCGLLLWVVVMGCCLWVVVVVVVVNVAVAAVPAGTVVVVGVIGLTLVCINRRPEWIVARRRKIFFAVDGFMWSGDRVHVLFFFSGW